MVSQVVAIAECRAKLETLADVYASFRLVAEQQTAPAATGVGRKCFWRLSS
jgi:hypothetical protein